MVGRVLPCVTRTATCISPHTPEWIWRHPSATPCFYSLTCSGNWQYSKNQPIHPRVNRRLPLHPASAYRSFLTSRCCPPATLNKIRVQGIIVDDRTVLRRQKHVPARNGRIRQGFMPRCKIQPRHENGFTVYSLVGSKNCIMTFQTTTTARNYGLISTRR